jgi:hypothetical protein
VAHRARFALSGQKNAYLVVVRSSRAGNGRCGRAWAVAAGGTGSSSSLAVRKTNVSRRAFSAHALADGSCKGTVAPGRTRSGRSHVRAVAKVAGGAGHRADGCAAEVGAVAADRTRAAHGVERRAGREESRRVQEKAGRATAIDARGDGVDVVVKGPHVHGAVRAKRRR